jgi:hypothetical protein
VQSALPSGAEYFVKPLLGCPHSAPGAYWRLICSLYGLRRAPKLWYEKLSRHLQSVGLKSSDSSPCLFVGTLIPGEAPIYVRIYVDDIIYFSLSPTVETKFEEQLSTIGEVDFMGQVSHILGIEFSWQHLDDGNISVTLTQQSFIDNLLDTFGFAGDTTSTFTTSYQSGCSIDSIPSIPMSVTE